MKRGDEGGLIREGRGRDNRMERRTWSRGVDRAMTRNIHRNERSRSTLPDIQHRRERRDRRGG